MKIFVIGGSGFIGRNILPKIVHLNEVTCLVHKNRSIPNVKTILGDACIKSEWTKELQNYDVVINLCGNDIARSWTANVKREIERARILSTRNIVTSMLPHQTLINASAIGYYGYSKTKVFDEGSPNGHDFLSRLTHKWEQEAIKAKPSRVVIPRLGVVLGNGGALKKMTGRFQKYLGGSIGSGKQFISWVHVNDVVSFFLQAIKDKQYSGVYNVCSPNPVTQREFNQVLSRFLPRMGSVRIPNLLLKATLGEFASIILEGQKVMPKRLRQQKYPFLYPQLNQALENIFHEN